MRSLSCSESSGWRCLVASWIFRWGGEAEVLLETEVLESPGWVGTKGTGWRRPREECGEKRSQDSPGERQGLDSRESDLNTGCWRLARGVQEAWEII